MSIEKEVIAICNMPKCKREFKNFIYDEEKSKLNDETLYKCQNCGALRPYDNLEIMKDIALALIKRGNRVFLVKRKFQPFENYWAFPGGGKEPNEHLKETAIRETKEETNLDIEIIKKLGNFIGKGDNGKKANLNIFFCKTDSIRYNVNKTECLGGKWYDINYALKNLQIIPQLKKYLTK